MKLLVFKMTLLLLTALRMVLPSFDDNTVPYRLLPVPFAVERISDVYVPEDANSTAVCDYPTVIQLCHQKNPADNGKLLASFEQLGSTCPIYESADDARTWTFLGRATDDLNEGYCSEWMPFLFELPADIGAFEAGTVILAGTSITGEGITGSTVTLYAGTAPDWHFQAFCNVDQAGGLDWGVWEPWLIYEEETGRLYCFYSDDSDAVCSQKLVYRYTTDLISWSEKRDCVACADPALRPGMVSVTKMGDGGYFMAYEMVGIEGNPIYCKTAASLDGWGDASDPGAVVCAAGKTFGSSPCAAWSPAGGKCGTLIVTAKHPVSGKSATGTDLFLSFDYGRTFAPVANPIPYTLEGHERCGYSPSLFVSSDGAAVYYVNNPSCYAAAYKITAAKIVLSKSHGTKQEGRGARMITDVSMDKARYLPGEKPVLTVTLCAEKDARIELTVRATHLTQAVCEDSRSVALKAGEPARQTFALPLPETDFTAYAVEVYAREGGETAATAMTAAEVASDWSRYPRYGYLTNYTAQTDAALDATIERLNRYHITGLFFYDALDRHDQPLAGTVESPAATWQTLARQNASFDTVKGLIDRGHARGMNAYLYNLLFGAYQDYADRGIDAAWGLYKDKNGAQQDYHGELPGAWETQRIYLFNPANQNWQDRYLKVTKDALDVFGYDGVQTDSLGSRGTVYDAQGNEVDLAGAYVPLLNRLHDELGTRVIFNPVSGYGMPQTLAHTDYDICYEEFWPWDGDGYKDLRDTVFRLKNRMGETEKGLVIAAYMDKDNQSGAFNPPGILLTDAVLMASGAAHLELGDTGMLKSEYYPGESLSVGDDLNAALQRYYSFFVAYENLLRDNAFTLSERQTRINLKRVSADPSPDSVWCINRENADGDMLLSFINLKGVSDLRWADADGAQVMPEKQTGLRVKQYVAEKPQHVYLASPDRNAGVMEELPFLSGVDVKGRYITFVLPELEIWDFVCLS